MGKYLPKETRAVYAFQWKTNSTTLMVDILTHLHNEGIDFELWPDEGGSSLIVGDEEMSWDQTKYVKVLNCHWLVIDGDELRTLNTSDFFEQYRAA